MGEVGICAVLQDNGAQREVVGDAVQDIQGLRLHPFQFCEMHCRTTYKARLLNRTPTYVFAQHGDSVTVHSLPIGGLSAAPLFDDWVPRDYAELLAHCSGFPLDNIFSESGDLVMTWIYDDEGELKEIPDSTFT